jgi:predicted nucleic acid-binding protein
MRSIFVDTAAWIALVDKRDSLHNQAWKVFDNLKEQHIQLVTTQFVVIEVADGLSSPPLRESAISFLDQLRLNPLMEFVEVSPELYAEGWKLYKQRPDKEWGLTDCTSFVTMTRFEIAEAFTSDHHFEQAGFQKLLH